jgi:muramidase (phage lysozyme)
MNKVQQLLVLIGALCVVTVRCGGALPQATLTQRQLTAYVMDPFVRAFLDTIAYAEGTYEHGQVKNLLDGYYKQFTYATTQSLAEHPRRVVCTTLKNGKRLCSSAAGRYQFITKTWTDLVQRLGLQDFSPLAQDFGAIQLITDKQALDDVLHGRFHAAMRKVATIWACLPASPYGQPARIKRDGAMTQKLYAFYQKRLAWHLSRRQRLKDRAQQIKNRTITREQERAG